MANLSLRLLDGVTLRPYQQECVSSLVDDDDGTDDDTCRAAKMRSGVVVLPCGSGKTLTMIAALARAKSRFVVICPSGVSVEQWKSEFRRYCHLHPNFFAVNIITTYTMFHSSSSLVRCCRGDVITVFDEVHVVPARRMRALVGGLGSTAVKVGMTGTPVREDGRIDDVYALIGPMLYECDWKSLTADGYISRVACVEMMTSSKMATCVDLITRRHPTDRILVFCDSLTLVRSYVRAIRSATGNTVATVSQITGSTPHRQRVQRLSMFESGRVRVMILSRVGDTAINLPSATVVIEVDFHGRSQRQEAQRLGRLLRLSPDHNESDTNRRTVSYFYILITPSESDIAKRRRRYLEQHGYAFLSEECATPSSSSSSSSSSDRSHRQQRMHVSTGRLSRIRKEWYAVTRRLAADQDDDM